jgi:hypothetical protein
MKLAILCAALAAAPAIAGELVARQGSDTIRLADAACTSEPVLSRLQPQTRSQFRAATAFVQGRTFVACWRMTPNAAHLVYEDGDQGLIPLTDLKPQLSA